MIRYILSLFISIVIYIGLIYTYIYFSKNIKKVEPKKKEIRVKISLLEPKKRLLKLKPKLKPTPPPAIVPSHKRISKHRLKPKHKKIIHKSKKNIHRVKKITHKVVKKVSHKPKIKKDRKIRKEVINRKIYKTPPPVIYTPEPIIEEKIYREPEIVTPIYTPQHKEERVIKRAIVEVATPIKTIKKIKRVDDLIIQKRKFLKRLRRNIYSNRTYPPKAKRRGIEGRVHLVFDITSSGEAINIRISNAPQILKKSVKKALKRSFPIDIPPILLTKFPMRNISIDIEFKLE